MKELTLIVLALAMVTVGEANAAIALIDQSNSVGGEITTGTLTLGQSLGQSFTPTLTAMDVFAISGMSIGVSTTKLELLLGQTVSGIPIATSATVVITNSNLQTIEYYFPSSVTLVPGTLYTARLKLISGDSYRFAFSSANPYARGIAFNEYGDARPTIDWVFAEGLAVPEPGMLVLLGVGGMVVRRVRRAF